MKEKRNTLTKQIAITAVLLAICIASQFFKNLSVYITGPIINLCLILTTVFAGLLWGIALSVVTPITSYLITGSPIMAAIPGIIPLVMLGNAVLVILVNFCFYPEIKDNKPLVSVKSILMAALSALVKAIVMGITISLIVLPAFIPEKMTPMLKTFQTTFSVTQLITAIIGFVYFYILYKPLKKVLLGEAQ